MVKFLVLGSEGLLGSAFCFLLEQKKIQFIRWDIKLAPKLHDLSDESNLPALREAVDSVDYVLFAAYDVGGAKYLTDKNSTTFMNNNMRIMCNVFKCLQDKKFVFCSSTMSHISDNPYGVSKRLGELYTKNLNGISVRLWNIYGYEKSSQRSHVIADYIHMANTDGIIKMMTTGQEKRQMLETSDCAEALWAVFDNYEHFKNGIVDISSGQWVTISEIAAMVAKLIPNTTIVPGKETDKCHTTYVEPSTEIFDYWKPKLSLEDGISKFINRVGRKNDSGSVIVLGSHIQDILTTTLLGKGDSDKHLMTLFSIVVQTNSKNILELGVRGGSTTLPLLVGAHITEGKVTSVDIENTNFICPSELAPHWEFVKSDAIKYLESCSGRECPWDIVFIDDWHAYEHVKKELELLDFQVSPSTVILLHDLMYADYQPHYHSDIAVQNGQWAKGGPYRAVAELNTNFWEFSTIPANNGLTILRKKYSRLAFPK